MKHLAVAGALALTLAGAAAGQETPEGKSLLDSGKAAFAKKDLVTAIRDWTRCVTLEPGAARAHAYLCVAYARTADPANMMVHLGRLKALDPKRAQEVEAKLEHSLPAIPAPADPRPAAELIKLARPLYEAGQFNEARPLLEAYVRKETQDEEGHYLLGMCYVKLGNTMGALAECFGAGFPKSSRGRELREEADKLRKSSMQILTDAGSAGESVHTAASLGHESTLRDILKKDPRAVDAVENGKKPIDVAIITGRAASVKILAAAGAKIPDRVLAAAPLELAIENGDENMVIALVEAGVDPKQVLDTPAGPRTPVELAVLRATGARSTPGRTRIVEYLKSRGAVPRSAATIQGQDLCRARRAHATAALQMCLSLERYEVAIPSGTFDPAHLIKLKRLNAGEGTCPDGPTFVLAPDSTRNVPTLACPNHGR